MDEFSIPGGQKKDSGRSYLSTGTELTRESKATSPRTGIGNRREGQRPGSLSLMAMDLSIRVSPQERKCPSDAPNPTRGLFSLKERRSARDSRTVKSICTRSAFSLHILTPP